MADNLHNKQQASHICHLATAECYVKNVSHEEINVLVVNYVV